MSKHTFKRGKKIARKDERTLSFSKYFNADKALPAPPTSKNWSNKLSPNWGMMGNDTICDCTCAGAGHLIMNWTGNALGKEAKITKASIIAAYSAISGYNPKTGNNDNGADLLTVLNFWRNNGIAKHKISAFVKLTLANIEQVKQSINLFGGVYIGLELPDALDDNNTNWDVPATGAVGSWKPNPNNGHCVVLLGYDESFIYFITWGMVYKMTWKFYLTYNDESFCVLSPDWFNKAKKQPDGFDFATLQADLRTL